MKTVETCPVSFRSALVFLPEDEKGKPKGATELFLEATEEGAYTMKRISSPRKSRESSLDVSVEHQEVCKATCGQGGCGAA